VLFALNRYNVNMTLTTTSGNHGDDGHLKIVRKARQVNLSVEDLLAAIDNNDESIIRNWVVENRPELIAYISAVLLAAVKSYHDHLAITIMSLTKTLWSDEPLFHKYFVDMGIKSARELHKHDLAKQLLAL
jgi:hypothetical protein